MVSRSSTSSIRLRNHLRAPGAVPRATQTDLPGGRGRKNAVRDLQNEELSESLQRLGRSKAEAGRFVAREPGPDAATVKLLGIQELLEFEDVLAGRSGREITGEGVMRLRYLDRESEDERK